MTSFKNNVKKYNFYFAVYSIQGSCINEYFNTKAKVGYSGATGKLLENSVAKNVKATPSVQ